MIPRLTETLTEETIHNKQAAKSKEIKVLNVTRINANFSLYIGNFLKVHETFITPSNLLKCETFGNRPYPKPNQTTFSNKHQN